MANRFECADYYTVRDDEPLEHHLPEDALVEHIDMCRLADPTTEDGLEDAESTIARIAPINVYAYDRNEVSDSTWLRLAERAACAIVDSWEDDGDLNGGEDRQWTPEMEKALATALIPAIKAVCPKPYSCHQVGPREYSAEEILKIWQEAQG